MKVAIISARRPENVAKMRQLGVEGTWFVGEGDGDAYRAEGAEVVEAGALCRARNMACDWAGDDLHLQVSDDLRGLWFKVDDKTKREVTFSEVADEMATHITENCRLVGVAPTDNTMFAKFQVRRSHFILGDLCMIAPSKLRWDEELLLKEDYDFTCAHLRSFGEVARLDWVIARFQHGTNPGGAVSYRTDELQQQSIERLQAKWGSWIRLNAKRPGEVLLRVT